MNTPDDQVELDEARELNRRLRMTWVAVWVIRVRAYYLRLIGHFGVAVAHLMLPWIIKQTKKKTAYKLQALEKSVAGFQPHLSNFIFHTP